MDHDMVFEGVRTCIAEVRDIAPDSIGEDSLLIADLGLDSLDLLDLTFRLECRFGIRISLREIGRAAQAKLGDIPLEIDGVFTPEALAELRRAMPEIPPGDLADGRTPQMLPHRFRVATLVNLVSRLLQEKPEGQREADDDE